MILTREQNNEMLAAAKPLIKWISENCNMHCRAVVDDGGVELFEGIARQITNEFLHDLIMMNENGKDQE